MIFSASEVSTSHLVARKGIPDSGVRLIHWFQGRFWLNFSTRTFIGYGEVKQTKTSKLAVKLTWKQLPDRDPDYPPLTFEEREAFGGWQWVADQYSLETELESGDIQWQVSLMIL